MADSVVRLKVESQEYDAKLKRATEGLTRYADGCRKVGGTLADVEKETLDFVKAIGNMETTSRTATGKLAEMKKTFVELSAQYKQLTDQEKQSPFGKALSESLNTLKGRIQESKTQLDSINREIGNMQGSSLDLKSVIGELGGRFGVSSDALGVLTTGTVAYTAAIGAAATAVVAATKAWADYNSEIARQQQVTTVTTGLQGDDADRMTAAARALSKTYDVDFREAINAANTLMTQFGKTGDEAIQLLRDGMQGMIMGDGPKLLSMIQQYAPAFRDAGVSASQLVAVIQNSEGGIFTDQNMNAIVMGIKNIRLMTSATSDALAQLGIDGKKMSQQLSDGTLTIFDALKQVAEQIENVDSNSQAAGQVMQQVFGRQGAMAGTKLGEAIATLNTNLEETKRQTGEVGQAYDDLYKANVRLEKALQETFGYKGWEEMATGLKTKLYTAMADVLEITNKIRESWVGSIGKTIFDVMTDGALKAAGPLGQVLSLLRGINSEKNNGSSSGNGGAGYSDIEKWLKHIGNGASKEERQSRYDRVIADLRKKLDNIGKERRVDNPDGSTSFMIDSQEVQAQKRNALERRIAMLEQNREKVVNKPVQPIKPINPTTTTHTLTKQEQAASSIQQAEQRYQDAVALAAKQFEAGNITEAQYKKQLEQGQQRLYDAYGQAYQTYADPKYKEAQAQAADAIVKLGGEVKTATEAQKAAEKAARELEAAQKKLADAQTELANAQASGDLSQIYAAEKKVKSAQTGLTAVQSGGQTEVATVPVQLTTANLDAFKKHLQDEMASTNLGDPVIKSLEEQMSDATALSTIFGTAIQNGIDTSQFDTSGLMQRILNKDDISDTEIQGYIDTLNEQLKSVVDETEWPKIALTFDVDTKEISTIAKQQQKDAQAMAQSWQAASSAIQSVGNAMSQIEDPAAKVMGTIAQAISSVALGAANALASSKEHPDTQGWAWIAYAASVAATMVSTITAIHSATGYANGGVVKAANGATIPGAFTVPGTTYSGDQVPAMLNAGEVVLNRAQQGNLASQLEGSGMQNLRLSTELDGRILRIVLNNDSQSRGRGKYVTSTSHFG